MSALILSFLLAMQIEVTGNCPGAAEVEEKLIPLLPPGFASASTDRATITEDADGLSVALARPDGRATIARRRFPRARTCAEQAETVAVALAVWEAQIHPEISLRLDRLAAANVAPPPVERAPTLVRAAEPAPAPELAAALGAGAAAGWQPDSITPGGRIDATLGSVHRSWRARLTLAALGNHTLSLPPGEAIWWRTYLAAGADYVLPVGGRWQLAAGAGGVAGFMTARGSGFSTNRTARSADLGIEAMLRIELRLARVRPWFGVALLTWLRRQTVDVTGETTSAVLPRLEPLLAAGADFVWLP